ncbi:hypothetical protein [Alishewanella sp. SMS8]|uniref:hypothetical protein n=1 Tax=Alishewanella sp. SMS8 TaxID=2994676 RepID=UPI0027411395|nr:hypothetical protein [Alishewanella sp. SMS8]MDP5460471.1 hypothetical protein [Alishewanella sp. SMS8]
MDRLLTPFANLVFLVFVAIHVSTYFELDFAVTNGLMSKLHGTAILVAGVFIFLAKRVISSSEEFFKLGGENAPILLGGLFFPVMPYILMNFFLCIALLEGGNPKIINGAYFLVQKGTVIREVDYAGYNQLLSYQLRLFTGHWVLIGWAALLCAKLIKSTQYKNA